MTHTGAVLLAVLSLIVTVQYASLAYVLARYRTVAAAEVRWALFGAAVFLVGVCYTNIRLAMDADMLFNHGPGPGWHQVIGRVPQVVGGWIAFHVLRRRLDVRVVSKRLAEEAQSQRSRERELDELRRMESLGRMARGIVHDINHIITIVKGFGSFIAKDAALLDEGKNPDAYARLQESLGFMGDAVAQAEKLRDDLMNFSRGGERDAKIACPNAVVREVTSLLRFPAVEVRMDLCAPEEYAVALNPASFRQVLLNLAINGRDAMPTGGKLRIQTIALDGFVGVRVSDNGCGMAPDVAVKAFEPFYTTKAKGEGTGLGLSTVYGIVTAAGGKVRITTDAGEGTDVLVTLPLASPSSS